jgi:hypothetical protein
MSSSHAKLEQATGDIVRLYYPGGSERPLLISGVGFRDQLR